MGNTFQFSKFHSVLVFVFSLFLNFMISTEVYSQKASYDSVNKPKYVKVDLQKTYERVLAKGYESIEMLEYLGNYYYNMSDFKKSKMYFDRILKNKKYKNCQISCSSIEKYGMLTCL